MIRSAVVILSWILSGMYAVLPAQSTLDVVLEGKSSLHEIMDAVDQYYRENPEPEEGFESKLTHWKRWEWYLSGRLGPQGEFVHIPQMLMQGMREREKMEKAEQRNINSSWSFTGPSTSTVDNPEAYFNGIGRVDRIVFHPTNANIIFLCTPAGGLWNTLNGGSTWTNLTDYIPSTGVSGFVISHANQSTMYMLTGDGDTAIPGGLIDDAGYIRPSIGVLKSTDGGISWHETGAFPDVTGRYLGYELIQNPDNADILLAATSNGLYRTTNGGETWVRELSLRTWDVAFKPGDPSRVYAATTGIFWISTDGGDTWQSGSLFDVYPFTCGSDGGGRIQIAVAPSNSSRVYLLAGPVTGTGAFCGFWRSNDSGANFARQSFSPNVFGTTDSGIDDDDQSDYDIALAVKPTLSTTLVVGGCTVWRSTDGGAAWTHVTSYREDGAFAYIHPDIHDLEYNPLNGWLYAATDGGVYRSQDDGATWTDLSPNIETSQIYHMAGWDGHIHKLVMGMQDNGVKYRKNNSTSFTHIVGGDGFDMVFNPNTGQPLYGTINRSYVIFSDDGDSYQTYNIPGNSSWFKTVAIHNVRADTVLIGSSDIFKSTNGGDSWVNKGASGSWALTSCPSNSTRFYAAGGTSAWSGDGALYFSGDIGETWTIKSNNTGFPSSSNWTKITDVTVRPNQSSTVWACFGGFNDGYKVVMSTNTGDSWTNMTANLPNVPINCLAIDNNNGAYAGTDIGVFYRGPTMSNWMPWSNGLPNTPVTELVIYDDGTNKRIRAATFGRGVWTGIPASDCDASVVVTGNLEGVRHYESSNALTSTSTFVEGGIGTFVSFQSGNYITLGEGFFVVDDSEFLGFISPCGEGGIPSLLLEDQAEERTSDEASVIPLRRQWDPDDGLPYGAIEDISHTGEKLHLKYRVKEAGSVRIYAARNIQEELLTLHRADVVPAGSHGCEADISKLPPAFHYLILFVDGKLAHFQELDLRG